MSSGVSAQWELATNPDEQQLGQGGIAIFNDTLYTGAGNALYKSENGSEWGLVVPESGFNNSGVSFYKVSSVDSFLIVSARRQVQFSKDGIIWDTQSWISGSDEEDTPRHFVQLGNTIVAGIQGDTNGGGDGIYKKTGDEEWALANEGFPEGQSEDAASANAMVVSEGRILVPTLEGLYVSDDTASTWTETLSQNLTNLAAGNEIVLASTFRSGRAYMYKSTDNGDTFTEVSLPSEMSTGIKAFYSNGDTFFASVETYTEDNGGLFVSTDGENWSTIGLTGTSISSIITDDENIYVTVNRSYTDDIEAGIWITSLSILGTSVEETTRAETFELSQNYPNPFNPSTNIGFTLNRTGEVRLSVFNSIGQRMVTLVEGVRSAGNHTVTFDARGYPSGIYYYRIEAGGNIQTKRMTLIK
jgi:hypothetical protein